MKNNPRVVLKLLAWLVAGWLSLALFGCASREVHLPLPEPPPPAPVQIAPPPPPPLQFTPVGSGPIEDRSTVAPQHALAEANRVWAAPATDRAAYLRSARLLNGVLAERAFTTSEEEVRLATMALQNALMADDAATLRVGLQHWEHGFKGIRYAPNAGEVETFLVASRRVGFPLPEALVAIAHPEIQAVLGLEK